MQNLVMKQLTGISAINMDKNAYPVHRIT